MELPGEAYWPTEDHRGADPGGLTAQPPPTSRAAYIVFYLVSVSPT